MERLAVYAVDIARGDVEHDIARCIFRRIDETYRRLIVRQGLAGVIAANGKGRDLARQDFRAAEQEVDARLVIRQNVTGMRAVREIFRNEHVIILHARAVTKRIVVEIAVQFVYSAICADLRRFLSVDENFRRTLTAVQHEADDEIRPREGERCLALDTVVTRLALLLCHDLIAFIVEPRAFDLLVRKRMCKLFLIGKIRCGNIDFPEVLVVEPRICLIGIDLQEARRCDQLCHYPPLSLSSMSGMLVHAK